MELFKLFITFFKIGLFTFGGGYAMISQIKEEMIEKKHWLSEDELMQIITIAESTPGPIAINLATYVGYQRHKILGSLCATIGVVLPSLFIIFIISLFLDQFMKNQYIKNAFIGINACVAFLIMKTGIEMLVQMSKKPLAIISFIVVFALLITFEILAIAFSVIYYILIGGVIGIIAYSILGLKYIDKENEV
ncbi:TPA: chromate transporter [Candidatus Avacholeplasma faecigallinarum]|nr:chromate transporter [Candidatus Avacholeplasma faecigallinarum]